MLDSKALTKPQSLILIAVVVVAAVGGGAAYVLLSGPELSSETIKIGVCADLDGTMGKAIWQGAVLAAEQVNAEGGVLGRNFTIVAQDDDTETPGADPTTAQSAFTKLMTVDEADFIIFMNGAMEYRERAADYRKILFSISEVADQLTQDVLDDYDRYKYYFRNGVPNETSVAAGMVNGILTCREHTEFNKIAFLYNGLTPNLASFVSNSLSQHGFDVVLSESIPFSVIDFSSYFAKAEEAGAEILYPTIFGPTGSSFVKEYYDRQSPMVMWGIVNVASKSDFWQLTEGKCQYATTNVYPVTVGYPLTAKCVPTRETYIEKWGEEITNQAAAAYDTVRFILPDAIERAGTIETDAVIEALEETDVETSLARRFIFTSSHDIMIGEAGPNRPREDYFLAAMFQWQDGVQVPVYPIEIMEEAGATYVFPDWPGPWDEP